MADFERHTGFYPLLSPSGLPLTRKLSDLEPAAEHKPEAKSAASLKERTTITNRSIGFNHAKVQRIGFLASMTRSKTGRIVQKRGGTESSSFATRSTASRATKKHLQRFRPQTNGSRRKRERVLRGRTLVSFWRNILGEHGDRRGRCRFDRR